MKTKEKIRLGQENQQKWKSNLVIVELTLSDDKRTTAHKINKKATSNYKPVKVKEKVSSPITGLDRSRGFQEVKFPRFRDNGTG